MLRNGKEDKWINKLLRSFMFTYCMLKDKDIIKIKNVALEQRSV